MDAAAAPNPAPAGAPNARQRDAIGHRSGPLRILAGAGTGKTQTLTDRFVAIVQEEGVPVHRLLALTFSRKAAAEMRSRVLTRLPDGYRDPWILTFHGFCLRLLREWWEAEGVAEPALVDEQAEARWFRRTAEELVAAGLRVYHGRYGAERLAGDLDLVIRGAKENLIDPDAFARYAAHHRHPRLADLADAYRHYDHLLRAEAQRDFADLAFEVVTRLRTDPALLARTRERFLHVMVDEFQDTNRAQYDLLRLLVPDGGNLCVVGDPNQAIYTFRGSRSEYIRDFRADYPSAVPIELVDNYRSPRAVLEVANRLARHEGMEEEVQLLPGPDAGEGEVSLLRFTTIEAEASGIAAEIARRVRAARGELRFGGIAVLARSRRQLEPIAAALDAHGIPRRLDDRSGVAFAVVQDLLAAIRLTSADLRWPDAVRLAVLAGADPVALRAAEAARTADERRALLAGDVAPASDAETALLDVVACFQPFSAEPLAMRVYRALAATGHIVAGDGNPELGRFLRALLDRARDLESRAIDGDEAIRQLLADLDPGLDGASAAPGGVELLTIHAAKGLEWPLVIVAGLAEGLLPLEPRSERDLDFASLAHWESDRPAPAAGAAEALPIDAAFVAEERRLCYVAVTRAKSALVLTAPQRNQRGELRPSRFLAEMALAERTDAAESGVLTETDLARGLRRRRHEALIVPADAPAATGALADVLVAEWAAIAGVAGALPFHDRVLPAPYAEGDALRLSPSGIDRYLTCPRQFLLANLLRLEADDDDRVHLGIGSITHDALKQLNQRWQATGTPPDDAAVLGAIADAWTPEPFSFPAMQRQARLRIEGMLRRYYAWERERVPRRRPVAVEESFAFRFGHHHLTGRIDVAFEDADGRIAIMDYKTGGTIPARSSSIQLFVYHHWWRVERGAAPEVGYIGLRRSKEADKPWLLHPEFDEKEQVKVAKWKDADLEKIEERIMAAVTGLIDNVFEPIPGDCARCSVAWLCPLG